MTGEWAQEKFKKYGIAIPDNFEHRYSGGCIGLGGGTYGFTFKCIRKSGEKKLLFGVKFPRIKHSERGGVINRDKFQMITRGHTSSDEELSPYGEIGWEINKVAELSRDDDKRKLFGINPKDQGLYTWDMFCDFRHKKHLGEPFWFAKYTTKSFLEEC